MKHIWGPQPLKTVQSTELSSYAFCTICGQPQNGAGKQCPGKAGFLKRKKGKGK